MLVTAPAPGAEARLGVGYNSFTGETRGVAVRDAAVYHPAYEGGQEVEFAIHEIDHEETLREHLGVSASASYSGFFSVDAKAQFSRETALDARFVYLLISVKVTNTAIALRDYELTDAAKATLGQKPYDWKAFHARYGDEFVHSIVSGGEFYALYEFQTRSSKEKDELKTSVKGAFGGFKAKADFERSVAKVNATTEVSVKWFVRGGKGRLPDPLEPAKLIEAALAFPEAVHPATGAPVPCRVETRDYNIVDGFPAGEDAPFYGRPAAQNRECFARLARLNDRARRAERFALDGAYGQGVREQVAQLRHRIEEEAREIAGTPFVAHAFPEALDDEMAAVQRQLAWKPMPGHLTQVAVGSHGHIWGLDASDAIYRWNEVEARWEVVAGRLYQIDVGADGCVMGINRNHDLFIWDRNRNAWGAVARQVSVGGKAWPAAALTQISVARAGLVYGVGGTSGFPYRFIQNGWTPEQFLTHGDLAWRDGFAEISAGSDGTVWLRDNAHQVYRVREHALEPVAGAFSRIAVGDANHVWGIGTDGTVRHWDGRGWTDVPGALTAISAGDDGTVWGITVAGTLVRYQAEL